MVPFHGKGVTGDHIPVPVSVSSHAFHHSGSELRTAEDSSSEIVVCWPDLDLIQKGLLQYAKVDKDPMGIESNPFPKVEVNMVTANLAKRLGSTVERKK